MADEWQPGDLALCVRVSTTCGDCGNIDDAAVGGVYTVTGSEVLECDLVLYFAEIPDEVDTGSCLHAGSLASRFRKIRPHTPDAEDLRTIAELNSAPRILAVCKELIDQGFAGGGK